MLLCCPLSFKYLSNDQKNDDKVLDSYSLPCFFFILITKCPSKLFNSLVGIPSMPLTSLLVAHHLFQTFKSLLVFSTVFRALFISTNCNNSSSQSIAKRVCYCASLPSHRGYLIYCACTLYCKYRYTHSGITLVEYRGIFNGKILCNI